ncbi:MAG: preprotein translocase subunit SecE [Minisyncoccia bacterium]
MKKYYQKLKDYFKSSFLELKKVNWPTKKEALRNTFSVIVLSLVVALGLGLLDYLLLIAMKLIIT